MMTSLRTLRLYDCQVASLPSAIGDLVNLEEINLEKNELRELPMEICRLRSLVTLVLSGNHLRRIPDDIGNLRSLKFLALSNNELTDLPESIGWLSAMATLSLQGNSLQCLPVALGKVNGVQLFPGNTSLEVFPASMYHYAKGKKGDAIAYYFRPPPEESQIEKESESEREKEKDKEKDAYPAQPKEDKEDQPPPIKVPMPMLRDWCLQCLRLNGEERTHLQRDWATLPIELQEAYRESMFYYCTTCKKDLACPYYRIERNMEGLEGYAYLCHLLRCKTTVSRWSKVTFPN